MSWVAARQVVSSCPRQIFKVDLVVLSDLSRVYHPDGLNDTSLFQGYVHGAASGSRQGKCTFQGQGRAWGVASFWGLSHWSIGNDLPQQMHLVRLHSLLYSILLHEDTKIYLACIL